MLHCPYTAEKTRLIVKEMTDQLLLQLVDKGLVTDQMVLTIGYDIENLTDLNAVSSIMVILSQIGMEERFQKAHMAVSISDDLHRQQS